MHPATAMLPASVSTVAITAKEMAVGSKARSGMRGFTAMVNIGENKSTASVLRPMKSNSRPNFCGIWG